MSKKEKIKSLKKEVKRLKSVVKKLKLETAAKKKAKAAHTGAVVPKATTPPTLAKAEKPAAPGREPKGAPTRIVG
jgi:hypothetical protein